MSLASPLKAVVGPPAELVAGVLPHTIPLAILALALLFLALQQMMKVMRGADPLPDGGPLRPGPLPKRRGQLHPGHGRDGHRSRAAPPRPPSIVPLAGTGVLSLRQIFPYTLGANVGTTITAILASFSTGSPAAVTVAFAHLSFNILGIAIYYPLKALPIWLARKAGKIRRSFEEELRNGDRHLSLPCIFLPLLYVFLVLESPGRHRITMWKQLFSLFKESSLCQEAFDEALVMLRASHSMHRDSVAALHGEGILVADIYERDRQLNKYERSVRRKILTHLAVSPKPDLNSALVITVHRHRHRTSRGLHEEHRGAGGGSAGGLRRWGAERGDPGSGEDRRQDVRGPGAGPEGFRMKSWPEGS